jgi:predicted TIM-barrel fold metal-dependent hydrolase
MLVAEGLESPVWLGTGFGLNSLALVEIARRARIPETAKAKILGENAARVLGL